MQPSSSSSNEPFVLSVGNVQAGEPYQLQLVQTLQREEHGAQVEKVVAMMSREGMTRNMRFTSCDVEQALGSASAICSQGHTIVFNGPDHPDGSYILNPARGRTCNTRTASSC